jgi:hypothetical protein
MLTAILLCCGVLCAAIVFQRGSDKRMRVEVPEDQTKRIETLDASQHWKRVKSPAKEEPQTEPALTTRSEPQPRSETQPPAKNVEPASQDARADREKELSKLSREELNAAGTDAGVQDAAELPNKEAVVEAILQAEFKDE